MRIPEVLRRLFIENSKLFQCAFTVFVFNMMMLLVIILSTIIFKAVY